MINIYDIQCNYPKLQEIKPIYDRTEIYKMKQKYITNPRGKVSSPTYAHAQFEVGKVSSRTYTLCSGMHSLMRLLS